MECVACKCLVHAENIQKHLKKHKRYSCTESEWHKQHFTKIDMFDMLNKTGLISDLLSIINMYLPGTLYIYHCCSQCKYKNRYSNLYSNRQSNSWIDVSSDFRLSKYSFLYLNPGDIVIIPELFKFQSPALKPKSVDWNRLHSLGHVRNQNNCIKPQHVYYAIKPLLQEKQATLEEDLCSCCFRICDALFYLLLFFMWCWAAGK